MLFRSALTFAELSALIPRSGGQYNFIGAGFGRMWAFLFGWMETFVDGAASCAVLAIALVIFLNDVLTNALGTSLTANVVALIACAVLVAVTILSLASVHANGIVASLITAFKVLLIVGIAAVAFTYGIGPWGYFSASGASGLCEGVPASAR